MPSSPSASKSSESGGSNQLTNDIKSKELLLEGLENEAEQLKLELANLKSKNGSFTTAFSLQTQVMHHNSSSTTTPPPPPPPPSSACTATTMDSAITTPTAVSFRL